MNAIFAVTRDFPSLGWLPPSRRAITGLSLSLEFHSLISDLMKCQRRTCRTHPNRNTISMDPVTAFGLASGVVQCVSFVGGLISKTRQLHSSSSGSLIEHGELEVIVRSLQSYNRSISDQLGTRRGSSQSEKDLSQLCEGVRDLCKQLIDAVESLKTSTAPPGRWDSFRQALRSVWNEKAIDDLMERLERHRSQIDSILIANINGQLGSLAKETKSREARIEKNVAKILAELGPDKRWQADVVRAAGRPSLHAGNVDEPQVTDMVSAALSAGAKSEREKILERQTVQSLKFADMRDRYEQISKAHKKTFEWVFDEESQCSRPDGRPWDDLDAWLMSNKQLYWVTGKPGAGKSTLMKFLYHDARLMARLRAWKSDMPIYPASFFFWNSGTTMQMSRIGLLQSLLYQTVSKFPHEVRRIFPDRWEYQELFGYDHRPWTWSELCDAFTLMLSDPSKAFFFLIDGLDEFDGDCDELAGFLLKTLSNRPNVKLCLASRPWLVFEDAFRLQPSLRMEELTIHDIRRFALETLDQSPMYVRLRQHRPKDANDLSEAITEMASGVFLWVRLVVKSLLDGLRDGDTVAHLHVRLLKLPRGLGDLFESIISDLNPDYLAQAFRIFCTVRASQVGFEPGVGFQHKVVMTPENSWPSGDTEYSLTLLSLSFVDEDPHAILSNLGDAMSMEDQMYRAERMRRHLTSRCKGLVEALSFARDGPRSKVQFLHRTVKDFLEERSAPAISAQQQNFDPHLALCAALLRHVEALIGKDNSTNPEAFQPLLSQFMTQCRWIEQQGSGSYVPFLAKMDRTAEAVSRDLHGDETVADNKPRKPWITLVDGSLFGGNSLDLLFHYAVDRGLVCYVKHQIEGGFPFAAHPHRDILCMYVQRYGLVELGEILDVSSWKPERQDTGFLKWLHATAKKLRIK